MNAIVAKGISRRAFLKGAAAAGASAGLWVRAAGASENAAGAAAGAAVSASAEGAEFGPWLHISPEGGVTVWADKVEMGQGTFTGYATLVGEELEIPPAQITVRHAPIDPRYGALQVTGGSTSLAERWLPLRQAAARAREKLRAAAAGQWNLPAAELRVADGFVHAPDGRKLGFGALAEAAAALPSAADEDEAPALKPAREFRYIGREAPRVDAAAKARGEAQYGLDARVPGMLHAAVARAPAGRRITGFDAQRALALPGVKSAFALSTGVAVVATNTWRARRAAQAVQLQTEAREDAAAKANSAQIRAEQKALLAKEKGRTAHEAGDAKTAPAGDALDVRYFLPHQAHAAMEPQNCAIAPEGDGCVVTLGTQAPGLVQETVARVLGCARAQVRVQTALLGGGFGRRVFPDAAAECAEIYKRVQAPVQLSWSREDDTRNDYFRPATAHRMRGALAGGKIARWEHTLVAPPLLPHMAHNLLGALGPEWLRAVVNGAGNWLVQLLPRFTGPQTALEGAAEQPYAADYVRVASVVHDPGIRVGIWRSVGHSHNGFVVESFVDELAHRAGADPLDFRRAHLQKHPRHLACLELAAREAAWGRPAAGHSQGLAVHESFGTVVAHVAEVAADESAGTIRVPRVTCAVDCGTAVNPDMVRAQIESGTVFGLTAALRSAVTFKAGAAEQGNFHDYPMLRMNETPEIAVHIVASDAAPTGVGEPGTPGVAAAVANAVFAATGRRLRELPLRFSSTA